jgi:short-subunit dehydrogenase
VIDGLRHALVTGAAGSIGGALARALAARRELRLSLVDKDEAGVAALASELGPCARAFAWDLGDTEALAARYAEATGEQPVDLLINCAGIMEMKSFVGTSWEVGRQLLAIDLLSPLRLMTLAIPQMRERRVGAVVNLASMAGLVPLRGTSYYGAAKAGLAMASEIARTELAAHGVHVLTVYPGPVSSALERRSRAQVQSTWSARYLPMGNADALAEQIVRAIERRAPRVIYPSVYSAAAQALGITRWVSERLSPPTLE